MALVKHDPRFTYQRLQRMDNFSGRVYVDETGNTLPSVTTILSATKDRQKLEEWKQRVGASEADRIRDDAAHVGTAMHRALEHVLTGEHLVAAADWEEMRGYQMAFQLANAYFHNLLEYYGAEVPVHYPGSYAGTCDLVGNWKGNMAIIDFKQSLRPKRKDWIIDYFHQLAAYACAHDGMHGTEIKFGVILVACQSGDVQLFTTTGREFEGYREQWMKRVEKYYALNVESKGNNR